MGNRWVGAVDRILWRIDIDGWLQTSRTAKPNFLFFSSQSGDHADKDTIDIRT